MNDWCYNEFQHVGVDYAHTENVAAYDPQMEDFRDYEQEASVFIEKLAVPDPRQLTIVDLGCGTGAFALPASRHFRKVYAVDVSPEMLRIASAKAQRGQIANIEFCHAGFLHFQPPEPVDVIYTKWAFHHLPDYWKQIGLLRMHAMLKPGGVLFLSDLVFTFDPDYAATTEQFFQELAREFSDAFVEETKTHIREEYSTFDWVLQGFIERAGFSIEHVCTEDRLAREYFCRKRAACARTVLSP
jgi:putative AdoMet-dependent methyltransferase